MGYFKNNLFESHRLPQKILVQVKLILRKVVNTPRTTTK